MNEILLLLGFVAGSITARVVWGWVSEVPEAERIKRILAASPDAEGFVALLAEGSVKAVLRADNSVLGWRIGGWQMAKTVNGFEAKTPRRETVIECIQDIPKFQEQIAALQQVPK